jgi:phosphosulfolactate synthase
VVRFANTLGLPERTVKPRRTGVNMVIDSGLPAGQLEDVLDSTGHLIDFVKFGWGTAVVTRDLSRKIAALRDAQVGFFFGGTLFELFAQEDRVDEYARLCREQGCRLMEISNGTIHMSNPEKAEHVRRLSREFTIISEVGFKDTKRSQELPPARWIEAVRQDLDAGASWVVLEARESGRSGICRPDGELRYGLIEEVLDSGVDPDRLLFEAPTKALQTYFVQRVGPNVNLGNVAGGDVIALETLRLGLRSDTMPVTPGRALRVAPAPAEPPLRAAAGGEG